MNRFGVSRRLRPWHGVIFFIIIMAAFFLICVPMQRYGGMAGLAGTELLILALSLLFAKCMGQPFSLIFPVRKPDFIKLLGTIILWFSTYLITMVITLIQYRLFPSEMAYVSSGLNSFVFGSSVWISILVVAILPAICEEAVHRGIIIHTLYSIRKEWVVVLLMGIYFGLFHTDPFRFLPTAMLGAAMSYIMLETENMVYSSALHGLNNLFPILLNLLLGAGMEEISEVSSSMTVIPLASIGIYMIFAGAAPFGLYLGNYLLHHKKGVKRPFIPAKRITKTILAIVIPMVCLFVLGFALILAGLFSDPATQNLMQESMGNF